MDFFIDYFNRITEWADKATVWVAVATLIFTWKNWWSNRKYNVDINIKLYHNSQTTTLPQTIKRRHLTRSEVQGILGAVYQGKDRYDIPFLATKEFSQRLEQAQAAKADSLQIDIKDNATFLQFIDD